MNLVPIDFDMCGFNCWDGNEDGWTIVNNAIQYAATSTLSTSFSTHANGACPGPLRLSVHGATPGGQVAIATGGFGTFTVRSGPCAGAVVPVAAPTLRTVQVANAVGVLAITTPPVFACQAYYAAVDLVTCAVTGGPLTP